MAFEDDDITATDEQPIGPHPVCLLLRDLRRASRLSLADFEKRFGIAAVVVGAYERGDRIPPLHKLTKILDCFDYELVALPRTRAAVRRPVDIVQELRAIADQIEEVSDLSLDAQAA